MDLIPQLDMTYIFKKVCHQGTAEMVDYLLNFKHSNLINFDLNYYESQDIFNKEDIPNGALLIALEYRNQPILKYFLQTKMYYIENNATQQAIDVYFSNSCKKLIIKIQTTKYLENNNNKPSLKI